jgi:integrase
VSASTQNQAVSALLFLYEVIFGRRLAWMHNIVRAQRPARLPVVLSREEVALLMGQLRGTIWLMASFMFGAGLRLRECVELRVKDISFDRGELTVRDGRRQGSRDDVAGLLRRPLANHLPGVKARHDADLLAGRSVALPRTLRAKYPNAPGVGSPLDGLAAERDEG